MAACCVPRLTQPSTLRGTVKWVSTFELSNTKMAMMYVGHNKQSKGGLAAQVGWPCVAYVRWTGWTLEVTEMSRDDSTINIVIRISISIIINVKKL